MPPSERAILVDVWVVQVVVMSDAIMEGREAEYQVRTKTGSTNVFYEIVPLAFSEVG